MPVVANTHPVIRQKRSGLQGRRGPIPPNKLINDLTEKQSLVRENINRILQEEEELTQAEVETLNKKDKAIKELKHIKEDMSGPSNRMQVAKPKHSMRSLIKELSEEEEQVHNRIRKLVTEGEALEREADQLKQMLSKKSKKGMKVT